MDVSLDGTIIDGMPDDVYHSGSWLPEPSLSSSGAKRLLRTSAARWRWEQQHKPVKKVWDFGHAAHAKVLGVGAKVAAIPADLLAKNGAASTAAAREWIEERRAEGVVPLKAEELAVVDAMASALDEHAVAKELLSAGRPEVSLAWRDADSLAMLRGRVDWLATYRDTPVVVDYKTCEDANPDEFRWDARKYDYHMQDSWYREGMDKLTGDAHGFLFIAQEKSAPYLVSVVQLDQDARDVGAQRNRAARRLWVHLMTRDEWPAHPGITTISIPNLYPAPDFEDIDDEY